MTVEQFYEKQNYPKYDKHDRKAPKFTYYDMCDFAEEYRKSKVKNLGLFSVIARYFVRALGFPFFLCLGIIYSVVLLVNWLLNYIRFGGEAISYTMHNNYKTIGDVYRKLTNNVL